MGTIVEKSEYLTETKDKIKESINNIGGSITSETTFREYAQELDNIYDNLPKVSGEGTSITLSPTLKGKLDFEDGIVGIGDTKQEIDLTENNLTSQSANGLTITVNTDKSITINGTASADTRINILNNTIGSTAATERTVEAGTYQLTGCPSGSSSGTKFTLQVLRSGYIMLEDTGSGAVNTITNSQTYTYIRIIIFSGTVCNNLVFRPKLLKIPSPSYPQDIEVVRGKNRFDGELLPNSYNPTTGEIEASSTSYRSNKIPLQKNETYYLSGITGNVRVLYWNNTSYVSSEVITMPNSFITKGNIIAFQFDKSLSHENIMLEKGSQATSYLPYNTIEVKARGKNHLLCRTDIPIGYTRTDNGITWQRTGENTFKLNGTASGDFTLIIGIATPLMEYLKTGETYILSGCPSGGSDSTYRLQIFNFNGLNSAFDTGNGATFVANIPNTSNVAIRVFNGTSVNNLEFNVQIELGSTKTSFIPFEETTQQLSLGEYEFAKIGNYVDTIEYDVENDKVYKNKAILKFDLVSTLNWLINNRQTWYYTDNFKTTLLNTHGSDILSNCFIKGDWNNTESANKICLGNADYGLVGISKASFNTLDELKTFLDNNNVYAYAPLKEVVKEDITGTLKDQIKALYNLKSYNGTTNISSSGNLAMVLSVSALKGE